MADLLPEALTASLSEDPSTSKDKGKKRKTNRITQIQTWVECFAAYTSVLTVQFPSRTQDLLAYLATIVHAARQYKGSGWQTYDTIFRQQAANDSTRKWADVNTSLWTTVFCNASPQDHCATCLCLDHTQSDCPTLQGSKVSDKDNTPTSAKAETTPPSPICMRFNSQGCTSATCSFRHVCLECHGNHRRTRCPLTYRQRPYPNRAPKDKQTNAPPSTFRPRKGEERKNSA